MTRAGTWMRKNLKMFLNSLGAVDIHYDFLKGNPSYQVLYDKIRDSLKQFKPIIVVVDDKTYRYGINKKGPRHAIVIVGMIGGKVFVHDPWNGREKSVSRKRVAKAWEDGGNITIELEVKGQASLEQEFTGDQIGEKENGA